MTTIQTNDEAIKHSPMGHPLYPVFLAAIEQAMHGKGERHGGASIPFKEQPLFHYIKMHGRGFATGQAAKKAEEAASTRQGQAFIDECLGAMVYLGAAILAEQEKAQGAGGQAAIQLAGEAFGRIFPGAKQ
jgi:hypothetical protein